MEVVLPSGVRPSEVSLLCERVRRLLELAPARRLVCDVRGVRAPDLATIDALARLCLTARRLGCRVELRGACPELRELLGLVGLGDVVACEEDAGGGLGLQASRQPEEREEPGRVEEESDPGDPIA